VLDEHIFFCISKDPRARARDPIQASVLTQRMTSWSLEDRIRSSYRRPASVWRESAVNAREGIPRFDQAMDVRAIPRAYFTYEQSGQRSQKSFEKLQKLRKLRPFSVLLETKGLYGGLHFTLALLLLSA
jgi:hypothetical protein